MLILGGEPPFVETPEPSFGKVIQKLNQLTWLVEDRTNNFNKDIQDKLTALQNNLNDFIIGSIVPIDQHLALTGAVHGETKSTIGLSKKDNYRTATLTEQRTFAPVNAFVTPQGAKAALEANKANFNITDYQQNNVFQFASYYYPDDYPVIAATQIDPVRYLASGIHVPVMLNGDRLVYSPLSDRARYSRQLLFASLPYRPGTSTRVSEINNIGDRYGNASWNCVGSQTEGGQVGFFRPLADKKVYNYKTNLPLPAGNQNYILYRGYANTSYKGLGVSASVSGVTLTLAHRFFAVANAETDPTLVDLVDGSYAALFDLFGKTPVAQPINGAHSYSLLDFITLPAGATLELDNSAQGPVTAMFWNAADYELWLNVSVPMIARLGGLVQPLVLQFTETFIPGSLLPGGSGTVRTQGPRSKDTLDANLQMVGTPNFVKVANVFDINNPTRFPGVVLNSGVMLKAISTKYGMRVKRYDTGFKGIKAWTTGNRPVVPMTEAITEMFAPTRHSPFGGLPERIIPFNHTTDITQYFVYGLNGASGKFEWKNMTWNGTSIVSTQTPDNAFGVRLPDIVEDNKNIGLLPSSLSIRINKNAPGVTLSPLAFTTDNGFKTVDALTYANGVLTLGNPVALDFGSILPIQAAANGVHERAKAANPGVNEALRKMNIQVFVINASKALIMISDGVSYVEVGAAVYAVAGGKFTLDFKPTGGLKLTQITPNNSLPTGAARASKSGDTVWMNSSDLVVSQVTLDNHSFVITRPFGENYGDISFTASGLNSTNAPVFARQFVNPARFFPGTNQIDVTEELFPALAIPNKGLFQTTSPIGAAATLMNEVGGGLWLDPYVINEAGWVRIPSGSRVILTGKTYILDREFAVKIDLGGTTYCYLTRIGEVLMALGSATRREVANNEIMFGIAVNGVLQMSKNYLVMNNHVITGERRGSAIPVFEDDGLQGTNKFFTKRDVS